MPDPRSDEAAGDLAGPDRDLVIDAGLPRTVTAAVSTVTLDGSSWRDHRFGDRAWQDDGWLAYDTVGECRFVANWVAGSVAASRLYVAEVGPDGEAGAEVTDPEIAALAAGPLGTGSAKAEALRLLGVDLFVPGEAFIVAEAGGAPGGGDLWWVVTAGEIKRTGDQIQIPRPAHAGGGTFTSATART